ncbi:MAG: branched-chain amino acid ABC transporter permease [Thermoflexales bacterium]|nr:branched-chain amino acid ABC transporter permease [Thermoflexales bacterium]
MNTWRQAGFWLTLGLVLAGGLVPLLTRQDTLREMMFTSLMFVVLASSLNILLGYTGYVSFGHIVFFGLGGYSGFYLLSQHGWPLYAAALAGGLVSALLAGLLGLAILRLRGAYFALATIGINEAARAFVNTFSPFGGPTGLFVNFAVYKQYGGPAQALWTTYSLLLVVTLAVLAASFLVKYSRFGLGLMAIREDEEAAAVMGVNAPRFKTLAYVISAFFPGVVGVLYFFKNGNVEPGDAFRLHMSIETLVMVMLGGQGTVIGPALGAVTYERLRGYLLTSPIFKNLHLAFAGLALLLIVLFVPGGVVGWLRGRFPQLRKVLE